MLKDGGWLSNPMIAGPILQRAARSVCAIVSGAHHGTGVLIGADLVLTAHHVVAHLIGAAQPNDTVCIFDYAETEAGKPAQVGMEAGVQCVVDRCFSPPSPGDIQGQPRIFYKDHLDYAVLQLNTPMGRRPASDGAPRGWIALPRYPTRSDKGEEIYLFQHPQGTNFQHRPQPLRCGTGEIAEILGQNDRFVHTARSARGASGGPCFNLTREFAFVGLHNAGHTEDDTVQKRFVPLDRIVDHIRLALQDDGFVNALFTEPPPANSASIANKVDVARRRDIALCLMDRKIEEIKFRKAAEAKPVDGRTAVPKVHVIVCREDDKPELFATRLEYLSLHPTDSKREGEVRRGLSKGELPRTFNSRTESWPAVDHAKRRENEIDTIVSDIDTDGSQLIVFVGGYEDGMDVNSERALVEHLVSALGARCRDTSGMVQCLICLTVPEMPSAQAIIESFTGLWPETAPPPGFGVCIELSDIAKSDLAPWCKILRETWGENERFSSEMDKLFQSSRRQRMARLVNELRDDIDQLIRDADPDIMRRGS